MGPDELLAQIADLMQQYLQLGPDTPAFDAVSQVLPAIQDASGGGGGAPGPGDLPPAGGDLQPPPPGGPGAPPDASSGGGMDGLDLGALMQGPDTQPSSLEDASAMALSDMKKRKTKAPSY